MASAWPMSASYYPIPMTESTNQSKHPLFGAKQSFRIEQHSRRPLTRGFNLKHKIYVPFLHLMSRVLCKPLRCGPEDRQLLFIISSLDQNHCFKKTLRCQGKPNPRVEEPTVMPSERLQSVYLSVSIGIQLVINKGKKQSESNFKPNK